MSASATSKVTKKKTAAKPKTLKARSVGIGEPVSLGRGEEGRRMALGYAKAVRGRPKAGETAVGTSVKSLRLYTPEWEALETIAAARGMSLHAAMREAVVQWLARAGAAKR